MNRKSIIKPIAAGATLIELMVALAITMVLVTAAGYVYLATRESQRALEQNTTSIETGHFALQMLGRDIVNAGFYPATMPPTATNAESYPPSGWTPSHANYNNPIFGCDGANFNHQTATCDTTVVGAPDSIVINYFNNEAADTGWSIGQRLDCRGNDPGAPLGGDPVNAIRKLNTGGAPPTTPHNAMVNNLPPQAPIFVSNFYALTPEQTIELDGASERSRSLACGGNGSSFFGVADPNAYQPMVMGIEDLQLTYGVFDTALSRAPTQYFTATQVVGLATVNIDGVDMNGWQRVVAVRVCILTRALGNNSRPGYTNCQGQAVTGPNQPKPGIYRRHVQVFAVRNRLNQGY
jgi:type IV pilus assembly protein PilW